MTNRKDTLTYSRKLGFNVSQTRLYSIWYSMHKRCSNKKSINYKNYGGRGVFVCPKWLSFVEFYKDMSITHKEGLTLDRIDNNKEYKKSNCRWASKKAQANNRRTNRYLTYKNKTLTLGEWSNLLGIKKTTLHMRLKSKKLNENQIFKSGLLVIRK